MTKTLVIGQGGHADDLRAFLKDAKFISCEPESVPMEAVGFETFAIAIGDNKARGELWEACVSAGLYPLWPYEKRAGCHVSTTAEIGEGSIINTGAVVEHGCKIGRFCHIAPEVVIGGDVTIGDYTEIGLNSTVVPGIKIGKHCFVDAGVTVTRDLPDRARMVR